jgi:hypothetical protein
LYDPAVSEAVEEGPYPGAAVLVAALATFFFPLISLIAALIMLSGEQAARRRAQLRTWAWLSGGWLALQLVVFLTLLLSVVVWSSEADIDTDRSGPCVGGPVLGESIETDSAGRAVVPCEISGTATVTLPG